MPILTESRPTVADQFHGLLEAVDHVVLVPVEGFEVEAHALAPGVLAQFGEAFEQDGALLVLAAGRFEGGQPAGEHAVRGGRLGSRAAQFADDGQLGLHLVDRVAAQVRVERPEEVQHVDAHRGHDDAVLEGGAQFGEPALEVAVPLAAQFDRVVARGLGDVPLLLEGVAGQQLFLASGLEHGWMAFQNARTTWSASAGRSSSR